MRVTKRSVHRFCLFVSLSVVYGFWHNLSNEIGYYNTPTLIFRLLPQMRLVFRTLAII